MEEEYSEEKEKEEKDNDKIEEKNKSEINDNNNKIDEKIKLYNIKIKNKNNNDIDNKLNDENIIIKENSDKIINESDKKKENEDKNSNIEFNNELITQEIKKLEKQTEKNDLIINKLLSNKKSKNEESNKSYNQIIIENEKQIKKDLFKNLIKDKNKLKKIKSPSEQTISKDIEIKNLKIQIKELQIKYNKIKNENEEYEKKNKQLEEIIIRLKEKNLKKKEKIENNRQGYKISLKKNYDIFKIKENSLKNSSDINLNSLNKSQSARIIHDDDNFYHLLTHKEKKCLKNLFDSYEEYYLFCNKLNIIDSRNKKVENQLKAEIAKLVKYIRSQERDIIKLNDDIFLRNEIINILESQLTTLKRQSNIITNKHKKILKFEEELKDENFNIKSMPNKIKLKKLNVLVNHYNEELNKIHIEKSKLKEIDKINKKIGNIYFIDEKFFENFSKNNDNNINNSVSFSSSC